MILVANSWAVNSPVPAFANARRNFPTDTDGTTRIWLAGGYDSRWHTHSLDRTVLPGRWNADSNANGNGYCDGNGDCDGNSNCDGNARDGNSNSNSHSTTATATATATGTATASPTATATATASPTATPTTRTFDGYANTAASADTSASSQRPYPLRCLQPNSARRCEAQGWDDYKCG